MLNRTSTIRIFSEDYKNKMRFIAGPRQSGKTTLAQTFLNENNMVKMYYNWDQRVVRERYYQNSYFYYEDVLSLPKRAKKWVCFDEIHKMPKWKNILKDLYDSDYKKIRFIITGSARLDLFRKSGDSLTGRYYLFHLFPFSLHDFVYSKKSKYLRDKLPQKSADTFVEECLDNLNYRQEAMDKLLNFSGFPEPLIEAKDNLLLMWKNNYIDTVIREDARDLTNVKNLENIARMVHILPSKIGSPLSINSLTTDIEVSYPAVKNYLYTLELCYLIFKIPPYSKKISRSIKKEQKIYFFDWTRNKSESIRFENYIAFELFNLVTFWSDHGLGNYNLHFVRNRNGQETDFLITLDNNPWLLIEAKLNDESIDSHHIRQAEILDDIPFVQLIYKNRVAKKEGKNLYVISASRFLC